MRPRTPRLRRGRNIPDGGDLDWGGRLLRRELGAQAADQLAEAIRGDVGDRPPGLARLRPAPQLEAAARARPDGADGSGGAARRGLRTGGPHQDADQVIAGLVDERRHPPAADVVETPAAQREALGGEVDHRRRVVEAPGEPGLDGVAVARCDVLRMAGELGADVARQYLLADLRGLRGHWGLRGRRGRRVRWDS